MDLKLDQTTDKTRTILLWVLIVLFLTVLIGIVGVFFGKRIFPPKVISVSVSDITDQLQNVLKEPDSQTPATGVCSEPADTDLVSVSVNVDTSNPRCIKVFAYQKLQVVNNTDQTIIVSIGDMSMAILPKEEYNFDINFGLFLSPGVHRVSVSNFKNFEIWQLGND